MFEVVEPTLDGDEVFDSSLLKQMVESMIASGKRNICIDLAGQDYLYSDAINALVGINKRMLDVMGRLSLVSPQPPVVEILKKGGIANILKIFENDDELIRVSQQLMGGAPPVAAAPAPAPAYQEPQSEFDELRSEIGSVFGNIAPPAPPITPRQREATPPPSPFADAGFQARQQSRPAFPPAPPSQPQFAPPPVSGSIPRYAPPPPPMRSFEPAVQKPPAPRPVMPPPPPVVKQPAAPLTSGGETRRIPAVPEMPTPPQSRQQPQEEAVFAPQPEEDLNKFEATLEKKAPAPEVPKRDRFDEDIAVTKKKPSFVPVLVTLVILIILGAGGYYGYITYSQKEPTATTPPSSPETTIPQVPVPSPEPVAEKSADSAPVVTPAPTPAPVAQKAPEKKPVAPAVDASAIAAKAAAAKEAAAKAAATKEAAAREAAVKAAAAKEAAAVRAAAAKDAATEKAATAREAAGKIAAEREAAIRAAGERAAAARAAAAAKAVEPAPAPKPSVVEVFDEPEPAPTPKPVVNTPPPPAPEPEPTPDVAASSGEPATVFLASIPPLADVYMDGKLIGKSNSILTVAVGTHTLRFVKGEKEITKQFTFTPGKNSPSFVKLP